MWLATRSSSIAAARSALARAGHSAAGKAFEQLAVGRRVRRRRVAGHRLGEMQAAPVGPAAQCPLDPAMLVAQRNLQMEHPLAVTVEPEMPGLDDPGMYRTDRDLVNFGAGDREERRVADRGAARREAHRLEPGMPFRFDAELLKDFALEVVGGRTIRGQRRVGRGDERRAQPDLAPIVIGDPGEQPHPVSILRHSDQQQQAPACRDGAQNRTAKRVDVEDRHIRQAQRNGVAGRYEIHPARPARTAAALPIASDNGSGIQRPRISSSATAAATIGTARRLSGIVRSGCSWGEP